MEYLKNLKMKKKRWFDDWEIKYKPYYDGVIYVEGKKKIGTPQYGEYQVKLSHSYTKEKKWVFNTFIKEQDDKIRQLIMLLDCAFTALTKKNEMQSQELSK